MKMSVSSWLAVCTLSAIAAPAHACGLEDPSSIAVGRSAVTELAVIESIAGGKLSFDDALGLGVMRLYGPAVDVAAARTWLTDRARG